MKILRQSLLALSLVVLALTGACAPRYNGGGRPGFGASTAQPSGTPLVLPAGVTVEGPIHGRFLECNPQDQDDQFPVGSGLLVRLCLTLRNSNGTAVDVTLPPGLIFVSESTEYQNGLLIQVETVRVPAQGSVSFAVGLYCLNSERHVPGDESVYRLGPVTDDAGLRDLLRLVEGRRLDSNTAFWLQSTVWEVAEEASLSDEDRARIEALPSR